LKIVLSVLPLTAFNYPSVLWQLNCQRTEG
jgi:hypothetical protein